MRLSVVVTIIKTVRSLKHCVGTWLDLKENLRALTWAAVETYASVSSPLCTCAWRNFLGRRRVSSAPCGQLLGRKRRMAIYSAASWDLLLPDWNSPTAAARSGGEHLRENWENDTVKRRARRRDQTWYATSSINPWNLDPTVQIG
jgi:hypothetical protein